MVKRSIEQDLRIKNFEARNGKFETSAVVKNQGTKQREQRTLGDCCSEGDNCSFRHDMKKRTKTTQPNPSPRSSTRQNERQASRTRSPRGKSPSGRMSRWPCKDYLTGTCTNSFCEKWHLSECLFYKSENGCRLLGKSALLRIASLMKSPTKGLKRMVTKVLWPCWKVHDNWVAYFRIWSRQSLHRSCGRAQTHWNQSDVVRFTNAMVRHATIRDQKPSLGVICPGDPHQRIPNAPKFEDRSQEETEWQERCAREAAWKLTKRIPKLKEKNKTAFFSPSENWCLPAPSTLKPEERDSVVDSGASMHMISKKDLNSAEMDTSTT